MPFLRLIIIYIVVIAIAFAIFNRDKVMELAGLAQETSAIEEPPKTEASTEKKTEDVAETAPAAVAAMEATEAEVVTISTTEAVEEQAIPATANPTADLATSLDEVRQAFWGGDAQKAETLYVGLAEKYATDANIQGEAGNFFYSQRRYSEAAEYFHRAGLLLIKTGNKQQVMSIINALQGIAPDKATDLRARSAKQP